MEDQIIFSKTEYIFNPADNVGLQFHIPYARPVALKLYELSFNDLNQVPANLFKQHYV